MNNEMRKPAAGALAPEFPEFTMRDLVRAQEAAAKLDPTVVEGTSSLGGAQPQHEKPQDASAE